MAPLYPISSYFKTNIDSSRGIKDELFKQTDLSIKLHILIVCIEYGLDSRQHRHIKCKIFISLFKCAWFCTYNNFIRRQNVEIIISFTDMFALLTPGFTDKA